MYSYYNPNPNGARVGDCVIRAISKALGVDWETAYCEIAVKGYEMKDMPSSNAVWGEYLRLHGFVREMPPNDCHCTYTVADLCRDFPHDTLVIAVQSHVITAIDGVLYDSWNSENEIPLYFWRKVD